MQAHEDSKMNRELQASTDSSDKIVSAIAYLSVIFAAVLLFLPPYSRRLNVRFHVCQSILLNCILASTIFGLGAMVSVQSLLSPMAVSSPVLSLVWPTRIACFAIWLVSAAMVGSGKSFRLPILARIADQQAKSHFLKTSKDSASQSFAQPVSVAR